MRASLALFGILSRLLTGISCELSPEIIDNSIKHFESKLQEKGIEEYSIINPIFGYLFIKTGALENIRFHGPELELIQDLDGDVDHVFDKSKHGLVELSILLFPSPSGFLCHIRHMDANFGYAFKRDETKRLDNIKAMSNLFVKVLKNELNTEDQEDEDIKKSQRKKKNFEETAPFKLVEKYLLSEKNKTI